MEALPELFAAIDESSGLEYLAFVVGDENAINLNFKHLPNNFTHMTTVFSDKKYKMELLRKFDFTGDILVSCVKFDILGLRKKIDRLLLVKHHVRKPKRNTNASIAYELKDSIQSIYRDFITLHGYTIEELSFEVDNPTVKEFLTSTNCNCIHPQKAHKIADCIAHANGKHWNFNSPVRELQDSFKNKFHRKVMDRISR
jgi:hypothetical protein